MTIRAILLDLEGVLYQQGEPIEGARAAVRRLRAMGYPLRFLTNTTTRPRGDIAGRLSAMGFEAPLEDVFSPAFAAGNVLTALDRQWERTIWSAIGVGTRDHVSEAGS